tara:strand:- start:119 stop:463 length:345 start_codon:yes stop_codon:yes gene_type:complete
MKTTENIITKLERELKMAKQTKIVLDCYNNGGLSFYDLTGEKQTILSNDKDILKYGKFSYTSDNAKNYEELYKIVFENNLLKEDKKVIEAIKYIANNIKDNHSVFMLMYKEFNK